MRWVVVRCRGHHELALGEGWRVDAGWWRWLRLCGMQLVEVACRLIDAGSTPGARGILLLFSPQARACLITQGNPGAPLCCRLRPRQEVQWPQRADHRLRYASVCGP
jgi:hypothetical protein